MVVWNGLILIDFVRFLKGTNERSLKINAFRQFCKLMQFWPKLDDLFFVTLRIMQFLSTYKSLQMSCSRDHLSQLFFRNYQGLCMSLKDFIACLNPLIWDFHSPTAIALFLKTNYKVLSVSVTRKQLLIQSSEGIKITKQECNGALTRWSKDKANIKQT